MQFVRIVGEDIRDTCLALNVWLNLRGKIMQCYKDKTFCGYGVICKNSGDCDRILTAKDREEARKMNLPLCMYSEFPECFVRWFE